MNAIKPIAETADSVTISCADWEAIMDALEDAQDAKTFADFDARIAAEGREKVLAEALPMTLAMRIADGESPIAIWRERRGMTMTALAEAADIGIGYLNDIEKGRKPGSAVALAKIAKALGIRMEALLP